MLIGAGPRAAKGMGSAGTFFFFRVLVLFPGYGFMATEKKEQEEKRRMKDHEIPVRLTERPSGGTQATCSENSDPELSEMRSISAPTERSLSTIDS